MKNQYLLAIACLIAITTVGIFGCGRSPMANSNTTSPGKTDTIIPESNQVQQFNNQLGEINDQKSAEKAVNSFISYADTRVKKYSNGITTQSLRSLVSDSLIKKIAQREAAIRNSGTISTLSEGGGSTAVPIDVGTITDSINETWKDKGVRITDDIIQQGKDAIEAVVPNLNPEKDETMSPLNAMVIGYVMVTGDVGTATSESVEVQPEKLGSMFEKLSD